MPKRDKPPSPVRTIVFERATEEWRHFLQVGAKVVAVLSHGIVEGEIVARSGPSVSVALRGGERLTISVDDIYKVLK